MFSPEQITFLGRFLVLSDEIFGIPFPFHGTNIKRCGFVVYPTNGRPPRTNQVLFYSLPWLQSIATGIEGLDCSKSSPYKLCTTSPIKLYHERVSRTGPVFPIFWGYKLIDKPVQNLYGLVLQSRPHSIPVAIDCTRNTMRPIPHRYFVVKR